MGKNGFSILDVENLRLHYAKTLDQWAKNYEKNVEKVKKMFDDILRKAMASFFVWHISSQKSLNFDRTPYVITYNIQP